MEGLTLSLFREVLLNCCIVKFIKIASNLENSKTQEVEEGRAKNAAKERKLRLDLRRPNSTSFENKTDEFVFPRDALG